MFQKMLQGGSGGSASSFQFSTDEQKTNMKWLDGKPLYTKTITTNVGINGNNVSIKHNIPNVDKIFVDSAFLNKTDGTSYVLPYTTTKFTSIYADRTHLTFVSTDTWPTNYEKAITVIYTKTTD